MWISHCVAITGTWYIVCTQRNKFWVRELLPVVSSYLQQYANLEVELDSMIAHVSLEHVTQFVSLSHCPVIFVCSISFFFQQSYDLKSQVLWSMLLYFCEDCCALPFSANYVWHFISKLLRNWFCFSSFVCTYLSATYYVRLVSKTIIANITMQHNSVLNSTKTTYSITRVEEHKCYHSLRIC